MNNSVQVRIERVILELAVGYFYRYKESEGKKGEVSTVARSIHGSSDDLE